MRPSFLFAFPFAIISSAFPSHVKHALVNLDADSPILKFIHGQKPPDPEDVLGLSTFDPVRQKISVKGTHRFIAPRPNKDLRGPCPGLNALANHGYIQRDGLTDLFSAATAAVEIFGFGVDLALMIALTGVLISGNPLTLKWSIGGVPPPSGLGDILFGPPRGISNSHNRYETDGSAFKGDAYLFNGDSDSLRLEYFQEFLNSKTSPEDDYSDISLWRKHRAVRFEHCVRNNPFFWWGPLSGVIVGEAGIIFPPEVMKNHSIENPQGVLNKETMFSFYSVTQNLKTGELEYTPGHERIPDNWYRQPTNGLSLARFLRQLIGILEEYPRAGSIGGNTGTVNSFTGVDLSDFTQGVLNGKDLLDPKKLACYLFRLVQGLTPDILSRLGRLIGKGILQELTEGILGVGLLDCPEMVFDEQLLSKFPGARIGA